MRFEMYTIKRKCTQIAPHSPQKQPFSQFLLIIWPNNIVLSESNFILTLNTLFLRYLSKDSHRDRVVCSDFYIVIRLYFDLKPHLFIAIFGESLSFSWHFIVLSYSLFGQTLYLHILCYAQIRSARLPK